MGASIQASANRIAPITSTMSGFRNPLTNARQKAERMRILVSSLEQELQPVGEAIGKDDGKKKHVIKDIELLHRGYPRRTICIKLLLEKKIKAPCLHKAPLRRAEALQADRRPYLTSDDYCDDKDRDRDPYHQPNSLPVFVHQRPPNLAPTFAFMPATFWSSALAGIISAASIATATKIITTTSRTMSLRSMEILL